MDREQLLGTRMMEREAQLPSERSKERQKIELELGLQSAASIRDRTIPLFSRSRSRFSGASSFYGVPFQEDMRELGDVDVAFVGAPLDAGTTFRSGTRWGPNALRRASALSGGYNFELGVDLHESVRMVDCGDINVINANIEKSFDQVDLGVSYIHEREIFPVILGGDHSLGYPDIRALTKYVDGNVGIIHFDRHSDLSEYGLDERTHGTPFFHATNIPNAPASNLVQIGIGGWTSSRFGVKTARERNASIITLTDIDRYGIARCAELALELAWKDAKAVFLSFDIDVLDPAFAPGTGTPVGGGMLPREALQFLYTVVREGIQGFELVEVAPQYDVGDITSMQGVNVILTTLGILVNEGKLGTKPDETIKPSAEDSETDPERRDA